MRRKPIYKTLTITENLERVETFLDNFPKKELLLKDMEKAGNITVIQYLFRRFYLRRLGYAALYIVLIVSDESVTVKLFSAGGESGILALDTANRSYLNEVYNQLCTILADR